MLLVVSRWMNGWIKHSDIISSLIIWAVQSHSLFFPSTTIIFLLIQLRLSIYLSLWSNQMLKIITLLLRSLTEIEISNGHDKCIQRVSQGEGEIENCGILELASGRGWLLWNNRNRMGWDEMGWCISFWGINLVIMIWNGEEDEKRAQERNNQRLIRLARLRGAGRKQKSQKKAHNNFLCND